MYMFSCPVSFESINEWNKIRWAEQTINQLSFSTNVGQSIPTFQNSQGFKFYTPECVSCCEPSSSSSVI